jgi:hypothetical protein
MNAVETLCIPPNMGRRVPEIIHAARDINQIKPRPWEVI